jgi:dimeric dUTPase (all-alpha-NTP-PPase superfamily)
MITLIEQMYEIQKELNKILVPGWNIKLKPSNWEIAILVEVGEAIDSLDWKWWKKQENDLDNLKVELIDILHFLLSLAYYEPEIVRDKAFTMFIYGNENGYKYRKFNKDMFVKELAYLPCNPIENKFEIVGYLLGRLGYNLEDIVKEYMVKNVLNLFRYNNGYKKGEYKKIWNGQEDNVVAYNIAKRMRVNETFKERFYKELEKVYKEVK